MQELFANGLANVVGGFFNCFPSAASLSRTAIVETAGGRTQLHNAFSATLLIVVLYGLSFLLSPLPKSTLSAIVCVRVRALAYFRTCVRASCVRRLRTLRAPACACSRACGRLCVRCVRLAYLPALPACVFVRAGVP
jgi:MFS superfamily sulfate permease-like transporter